ncbi:leech-derived tryptase inhibitor C-like [Mytilus galloprovincialis]|uniref:leech-derived tryptase inhibitor C-like n=1 Tax=Mytilus galloprovincialis TaxID=29158 RepID=UPI003F7B36DB
MKNQMLIVFMLFFTIDSVYSYNPKPCICPRVWGPVCSTTGKTYSNTRVLECNHAIEACKGECPCYS